MTNERDVEDQALSALVHELEAGMGILRTEMSALRQDVRVMKAQLNNFADALKESLNE